MNSRPSLPIDQLLPELQQLLQTTPNLVLEAAPGAGKTTRVPAALLELVTGQVLVLEPRRIAARLAARRVAYELGEEVGGTVGYQVRFEERCGPNTRLRFITEGILNRRLLTDPLLRGVDAVLLDEFHERHLDTDLALALLRRLQHQRPELRLIVMSATLDAAPVAHFLGNCPVLRSEGRAFPLTVTHLRPVQPLLEEQVQSALEHMLREDTRGNILIFLPGQAEIRRCMRSCETLTRKYGAQALALHGSLSPAEQDRAVSPSKERKVLFATNVAESSVTVDGVNAVIDSGLARFASVSPWTGLPELRVGRISQSSAIQRAGRAGRTEPGRVLRLYPEEDFALRAPQETPEIERTDLTQLLLSLRAMHIAHPDQVPWLNAPPAEAVRSAEALLDALGAGNEAMAARLARFPLPPRLARVVVDAIDRGIGAAGCKAAALLAAGLTLEASDLLEALDRPMDPRVQQQAEQLLRLAHAPRGNTAHDDDALLLSLLTGFPDRVARRRAGRQMMLSNGVAAEFAKEPPPYEFLLALDAENRSDKPLPIVRLHARLEPEWLLELFPERIREETRLEWHRTGERVERLSELLFDRLVLEETRRPASEEEAAHLLAKKALESGIEGFVDREALENFLARMRFAGLPPPDLEAALSELAYGLKSFSELRTATQRGLLPLLAAQGNARRLEDLAPASVRLDRGRQTPIHYEQDRAPWIASRLQDFFGMRETPRIGPERIPVVVHLLAPNQRAVQTTTDLAGFWERLYPTTRRELMRRYPRHAWPEDPHAPAQESRKR
ncbi:MAG: ATP-dependent helicase HrpB [Acidobacteriaceae bacterium]|nr:ATP-dependent helicase HrpB [Acidobacteriaceae bacterium]